MPSPDFPHDSPQEDTVSRRHMLASSALLALGTLSGCVSQAWNPETPENFLSALPSFDPFELPERYVQTFAEPLNLPRLLQDARVALFHDKHDEADIKKGLEYLLPQLRRASVTHLCLEFLARDVVVNGLPRKEIEPLLISDVPEQTRQEWCLSEFCDLIEAAVKFGIQVRGINFKNQSQEVKQFYKTEHREWTEPGNFYQAESIVDILKHSPQAKLVVLSGLAHMNYYHERGSNNVRIPGLLIELGLKHHHVLNFGLNTGNNHLGFDRSDWEGQPQFRPNIEGDAYLPLPLNFPSHQHAHASVVRLNGIIYTACKKTG